MRAWCTHLLGVSGGHWDGAEHKRPFGLECLSGSSACRVSGRACVQVRRTQMVMLCNPSAFPMRRGYRQSPWACIGQLTWLRSAGQQTVSEKVEGEDDT